MSNLVFWDVNENSRSLACAHITLPKSKNLISLYEKDRTLWPVMMDEISPTRKENSLNPTKMSPLFKKTRLWLLKCAERPTPSIINRWRRKTITDIKQR